MSLSVCLCATQQRRLYVEEEPMIVEIDEGKGGMSHLSIRLHSIADKASGKVYDRINVSCGGWGWGCAVTDVST